MEFILKDANDTFIKRIIINNIKDLEKIQKEYEDYPLIIEFNDWGNWGNGMENCPSIMIYNDWIE